MKRSTNRGFSLVELMIAMAVLAVGLLGGMLVIAVASASNGNSKFHATAATLAESTMERILAIPSKATGAAAQTQINDCAGHNFTVETSPGGANLISSGAFSGSVNFAEAAVPNYSMNYVVCSSGQGMTYDVRWRIDAGPTPSTELVIVSAKPASTAGPAAQLSQPVTLRTLRGDNQ